MNKVILKFYCQLNDFLKPKHRQKSLNHTLISRRSIKDLIESFGVPHVEIEKIFVNQQPEDFSYIVRVNDFIEIFPSCQSRLKRNYNLPKNSDPEDIKFVCDIHLGKLARRLRLLGFDVEYKKNSSDKELIEISNNGKRVLLTRDRGLLLHKNLIYGLWIRNIKGDQQMIEVINRLQLKKYCLPFSRCLVCNGELRDLPINEKNQAMINQVVPAGVRQWCNKFKLCGSCEKIFWQGSHYNKLTNLIHNLLGSKS